MKISDYRASLMIPRYLTQVNDWHGHIPFGYFLVQLTLPKSIVELGVCAGDSFYSFVQICAVLRRSLPDYRPTVVGVDTWLGDENCKYPGDKFYSAISLATDQFRDWATLKKSLTSGAVSSFPDGSIDLLHIDADHSYSGVSEDFTNYLPKLSPTGVILFHDTVAPTSAYSGKVVDGVQRLWTELTDQYPGKYLNFPHSNGLGVLFPNDFPNSDTKELITSEDKDGIYQYFNLLSSHMRFFEKDLVL